MTPRRLFALDEKKRFMLALIAPAVFVLIGFQVLPILTGANASFRDWHLHVLWLLPITAAEREYKIREGQEQLEQRFDADAIEYWAPERPSVA